MMKKQNAMLSLLMISSLSMSLLAADELSTECTFNTGEGSQSTQEEACTQYYATDADRDSNTITNVKLSAGPGKIRISTFLINGTKTEGNVSFDITLKHVYLDDDTPYQSNHLIELTDTETEKYISIRFNDANGYYDEERQLRYFVPDHLDVLFFGTDTQGLAPIGLPEVVSRFGTNKILIQWQPIGGDSITPLQNKVTVHINNELVREMTTDYSFDACELRVMGASVVFVAGSYP